MGIRSHFIDYSRGNDLKMFWLWYRLHQRAKHRFSRDIFTILMSRSAHRHGGYIGSSAVIQSVPVLPHGLHGIFISRYAVIGKSCWIYQNVTIGEIHGQAPVIGDECFIGAGAILIGAIHVGNGAKIGAGAVVCTDVPNGATVVSQPTRILEEHARGNAL